MSRKLKLVLMIIVLMCLGAAVNAQEFVPQDGGPDFVVASLTWREREIPPVLSAYVEVIESGLSEGRIAPGDNPLIPYPGWKITWTEWGTFTRMSGEVWEVPVLVRYEYEEGHPGEAVAKPHPLGWTVDTFTIHPVWATSSILAPVFIERLEVTDQNVVYHHLPLLGTEVLISTPGWKIASITWAEIALPDNSRRWQVADFLTFVFEEGHPGNGIPQAIELFAGESLQEVAPSGGWTLGPDIPSDVKAWVYSGAQPGEVYENWASTWSITWDGNLMAYTSKEDGGYNVRVFSPSGEQIASQDG